MGVTIIGHNSAQFDRFSSGYSSAPVPNASPLFIGASYDLSGVGWSDANPMQSITMINDQYFMGAAHFMPSPGSTIKFYSPALAAVVSYTVDNFLFQAGPIPTLTFAQGDLAIRRLTTVINPAHGIASYPILDLASTNDYLGLPLLVYGHGGAVTNSPRLGTNTLNGFYTIDLNNNTIDDSFDFSYDYNTVTGPVGETYLQGGDSGSPTFASWNGQLALVGTHSAIGKINDDDPYFSSFDNFAAIYLDQIAAANISFTSVPEPSRTLLLLIALCSLVFIRRRCP